MSARDDAIKAAAWKAIKEGNTPDWYFDVATFNAALSAAGLVVVPREPTREMWEAAGNALVNGRIKIRAHHDYITGTVWNAMIAAALPAAPQEDRT